MNWLHGARGRGLLSAVGSLSTAASLILIFRFSVEYVSVSAMGLWALLQAIFLLSRVSGSGLGSNITRYVAVCERADSPASCAALVKAGLLLGAAPVAAISIVTYLPLTRYVDSRYADTFGVNSIWVLSGFCAATGIISAVSTTLLAVSEGMGKLGHNSLIIIASNVIGIGVSYPLIRIGGVAGIGAAYFAVSLVQLALSAAWLYVLFRGSPAAPPTATTRAVVSVLRGDSASLVGIGLLRLSFEPVTKLFLASTGSLAAVAAFDLALRVATQFRVLIQAGAQPLLAQAARHDLEGGPEVVATFKRGQAVASRLCSVALVAQLLSAPLIAMLALGSVQSTFLNYFSILAVANMINAMGLMGYYYYLSAGKLRALVWIHVVMALVNVLACVICSWAGGSTGVVASYALTMILGGILLMALLPREIRVVDTGHGRMLWIGAVGLAAAIPAGFARVTGSEETLVVYGAAVAAATVLGLAGKQALRGARPSL